jgi:hypothetical protein
MRTSRSRGMGGGLAWLGFAGLLVSASSCSPKVYLVDRQTVLEEEAAGEWPEFERALLDRSVSEGPVEFPKASTAASGRRARLYNLLNGEVVGAEASALAKGPGSR